MTSVIPTCSASSATVEVVARSHDDILSEDWGHSALFIRIDYICIGEDGQQVSDNLQVTILIRCPSYILRQLIESSATVCVNV